MTLRSKTTTDQRMVYSNRSWEQFKLIQKGLDGCPGVRMFYYEGMIEILMPAQEHNFFKAIIAFLLEIYFVDQGIEFYPTGSMDQEREGQAFAHTDESYCMGGATPIPDLSIEVIFTSGNTTKLNRYRALGVPEVWFWEDGLLSFYHLDRNGYRQVYRSEIPELANLDIPLLCRCVLLAETSRLEAARVFRQGIHQSSQAV